MTALGPNGEIWWAHPSRKRAWLLRPAKPSSRRFWHILLRRDTLAPKEDHAATNRSCRRPGSPAAIACPFPTGSQEQRNTEIDREHARDHARSARSGAGRPADWLVSPDGGNRRPQGIP